MAEWLLPALSFVSATLLVYGLRLAFGRGSRTLRERLEQFSRPPQKSDPRAAWSIARTRQRLSSIGGFDRLLSRGGYAERVAADLAQAGVPLRVGEYLFLRWCLAAGLFAAGLMLSPFLPLALLLGVVGYFLPRLYLYQQRYSRSRLLEAQLVEALTLMAGSLRAGYSFLQALEAVMREFPAPVGEEFKLVLEDIGVGVRAEDALVRLVERCRSEEVDMAVTAMLIQRATGGNLAEVLETLAATIRDRLRIRREVQTLTAQERYSSYVVGVLPIAMFLLIAAVNPEYLFALFGTPFGQMMLVGAVMLELVGFLVIRRIMNIEV